MFPNPEKEGAVPFEYDECDRPWLIAIEWVVTPVSLHIQAYIPVSSHVCQDTIIEYGRPSIDVGANNTKYHDWEHGENDISFEDTIVVSREDIPPPCAIGGTSYTLWTKAHEKKELYIDGKRSAPSDSHC
jgi:hypothetical protein